MGTPAAAESCHRTSRAGNLCGFARGAISSLVAFLLLFAHSAPTLAADPLRLDEYQIKAGFLFNFTRFVSWPDRVYTTATSPTVICVVGDTPLADPLAEAAAGKVFGGRAVLIRRMKAADDPRGCHILFISSKEKGHALRILEDAKGLNILTVGEDPGLIGAGAVIVLSIQDNRVKVEINLEAAARAELKISAKLIAVSHIVSSALPERGN